MNRYLIIAAAALALCSCKLPTGGRQEASPVKVGVTVIGQSEGSSERCYLGRVEAARSVTLTAPYGGTLVSFDLRKGSRLAAGQTVAVIKSQSVESALQSCEATLKQAQDAYDRVKSVYGSGSVSAVQMVDIETKLEKAKAAMQAARTAYDNCTVKAPYNCIVGETHSDRGVELSPAQPIATVLDISSLNIVISVHENDINSIKTGERALLEVPALGISGADAVLSEKGLLSSVLSHSYECTLKSCRKIEGLMPGMSVKVLFRDSVLNSLPVVPAAAVQMDSEGRYVWLDDKGVVRKARIVVGGYSGTGILVKEGLQYGDKVIVEGYQKVSSGMKVTQ